MPIYDFRCNKCGAKDEAMLPVSERDGMRFCSCGSKLVRVISLPLPAIFAPTARGMALDTLNSGHATPDRWYKSKAERLAVAGLDPRPKAFF